MSSSTSLVDLLERSAREFPDSPAVVVPGGKAITYAELSELSDRLRDRLCHLGVQKGSRVGFRLDKSIDSVVSIFGILKAGAAYVPVDSQSPASRGAFIFADCNVKVLITTQAAKGAISSELANLGASPEILALDCEGSDTPLSDLLAVLDRVEPVNLQAPVDIEPHDLAYILYTSGSTGNPKGVVLSHGNAISFIDWCSGVFEPTPDDRFSSHAPFHFDLSIFDIYVPMKHGATLVLFGEALGKDPAQLAVTISSEKISIWYSTPSILSLLANYGKLNKHDYSSLRIVLFAGEVFPIPQYKVLHECWAQPRYFNLYGPTETNVCNWYEVPGTDSEVATMSSFPIGAMCEPNIGRVVDEQGEDVAMGESGELLVSGPNVMQGYWNLPEQNEQAFIVDQHARKWYRTGDIVKEGSIRNYIYVGRRDRMVKRRGYRVELGEIEVGILKHADVREAAAVAISNEESGVRVWTFVACREDSEVSIISLKAHSAKHLPPYMIPDSFSILDQLPRTSTDKIDYQAILSQVQER